MGEFGYKILNYEAGSIVEFNNGVRQLYHTKPAMLTNSLFLDFLLENDLIDVYKDSSTRDIICINFNYGSKGYDDEIEHIKSMIKKTLRKSKLSSTAKQKKLDGLKKVHEQAILNKNKFVKKTKEEIRIDFYNNGVDIYYPIWNKKEMVGYDKMHYLMLYRTPGKAKKGSCMFIKESSYSKVREFLYMGLKLPENNAPIVEIGAYSSLITSTIVDRIQIKPEEILILNDVASQFTTKVKSVIVENAECKIKDIDNYTLSNEMFDGQALIDTSIFPSNCNGYILLRHHFTKMAAFATNIQTYYQDYFGENYNTAEVIDMFGNKHKAKDIKLITTNNAIKWLKFKVSFEYWSSWISKNNYMFGIVKTAHESKFGDVQRMSYQMVNALNIDSMNQVLVPSLNYIDLLKNDDSVFIEYLKQNANFSNDYDVLVDLYQTIPNFERSEYFRERRYIIVAGYINNLKCGKVIQRADNLTIVGSPFAMLLHSVGEDPLTDPTFTHEDGCIQCYTEDFLPNEYLAEFRSPFNSRNNMGYLHNIDHEYFHKYFKFGKLIIAVNLNGTDFQDRNNGSDQDSDSVYTTNQINIVEHAKYCYTNYPTIVNNIPKDANHYNNSMDSFARIDNTLSAAQLDIGESSNLAQLCLTYTYNFQDEKYMNFVCILSVLAQVAIDSAKRKFDINIHETIKKIKKEMDVEQNRYPVFWSSIRKDFDKEKINIGLNCPMNSVYYLYSPKAQRTTSTLPMKIFFQTYTDVPIKMARRVEYLIEKYSIELSEYNMQSEEVDTSEYLLLKEDFDEMVKDIQQLNLGIKYRSLFAWLINRAFVITPQMVSNKNNIKTTINKNRCLLLKVLYSVNRDAVIACFSKNTVDQNIIN